MKRRLIKVTAALAAAVIMLTGAATTASAASRTTTAEVLGATRNPANAGTPAVLGATRGQITVDSNVKIVVADINNSAASAGLADNASVADIIRNLLSAAGKNAEAQGIQADKLEIMGTMDVSTEGDVEVSEASPLFVTFNVPGLTATSRVYILHYNHAGVWEDVTSSVGDGFAVAKFTSLSPVAIVVDKDTLNNANSVLGENRSPRTGESSMGFTAILFLAAASCSVILVRRMKAAN